MDARRLRAVSAAGLLVVVVGVAAATLETTRGGSDGGATHGQRSRMVDGGWTAPAPELPFVGVALAIAAVLLAVAIVRYRRRFLVGMAGAVTGLAVLAGIFKVLVLSGDMTTESPINQAGETMLRSATVAMTEPGTTEGPTPSSPIGLLIVALVVVLGAGALIAYWSDMDVDLLPSARGDDDPDETLTALGRTAGRAADRLEGADADVTNEVYRAWDEMTAHLDVDDGAARTPGEFRAEAHAAGMAGQDVDALTDLFEEVRYGGAAPTGERERDAVAALRRIETAYAEEGAS